MYKSKQDLLKDAREAVKESMIAKELEEQIHKAQISRMETFDNFVFQTISPFCEEILELKINKRELEQALLKAQARKPRFNLFTEMYYCPLCSGIVGSTLFTDNYCPRCGQKIDWEE